MDPNGPVRAPARGLVRDRDRGPYRVADPVRAAAKVARVAAVARNPAAVVAVLPDRAHALGPVRPDHDPPRIHEADPYRGRVHVPGQNRSPVRDLALGRSRLDQGLDQDRAPDQEAARERRLPAGEDRVVVRVAVPEANNGQEVVQSKGGEPLMLNRMIKKTTSSSFIILLLHSLMVVFAVSYCSFGCRSDNSLKYLVIIESTYNKSNTKLLFEKTYLLS